MHVLVISDIHANLSALEAVLSAARRYDAVWCLGDIVGYGPDPNECVEIIQSLPNLIHLTGNHDAATLGNINLEAFNRDARISAQWTKSVLSANSMQFLRLAKEKEIIENVCLVHGSPRNPVWEYLLDTYTASINFEHFETDICFVGHTHQPTIYVESDGPRKAIWKYLAPGEVYKINGRTILNPGSVGQPRDHDPRASFALYDTEQKAWRLMRVDYDVSKVQQRIIDKGLPRRHALRLKQGW